MSGLNNGIETFLVTLVKERDRKRCIVVARAWGESGNFER